MVILIRNFEAVWPVTGYVIRDAVCDTRSRHEFLNPINRLHVLVGVDRVFRYIHPNIISSLYFLYEQIYENTLSTPTTACKALITNRKK